MLKLNKLVVILIAIGIILFLSLYFFVDPASTPVFPKCVFHATTGAYCPGCGSQRAIHDILNGNIIEGFRKNLLLLLALAILLYECYIFILKKRGSKEPKNLLKKSKTTKIILIIVVSFWILRNIPAFSFLAP